VNETETTGDECVDIVREDLETKRDGTHRELISANVYLGGGQLVRALEYGTRNGLEQLDIQEDDNMGVIMKEPIATTTAMLGINKAGAVNAAITFELTGNRWPTTTTT